MLLRNYVLTAWRMIRRSPLFTLINITGLALGLACSLLIFIWIIDEVSYDKFHENGNRIFRINTEWEDQPDVIWTTSSFPLGQALTETYPFISEFSRKWKFRVLLKHEENVIFENNGLLVDQGFFRMFSFPVIKGDPSTLLSGKDQIVLTESLSRRLFNEEDPIGKIVSVNEKTQLTVSGIIADPPGRSQLQFSFLASVELLPPSRLSSLSLDVNTYIMTDGTVGTEEAGLHLYNFYQSFDSSTTARIMLQPYTQIHLNESGNSSLSKSLRLFGMVALLVLLVACINYMNLSTVRSVDRTREISIRKITGAGSRTIRRQFFLESALITFVGLLLAFILVELFREPFNRLSGKTIVIDYGDPALWLLLIAVYIITTLVSGIYPAYQSGKSSPVQVLSNRFKVEKGKINLRTLLVVFQYTISILLIISAITIGRQIHYIINADSGYQKENLLVVNFGPPFTSQYDLIREQVLKNPRIKSVTGSSLLPSNVNWQVELDWTGNQTGDVIPIRYLMVDYDFTEIMGMNIVDGRSFSREFATDDSIGYIVNETAVKAMDLKDPVGKTIRFVHADFPERLRTGEIIGVVEDFHSGTFHHEIPPMVLRIYRPWYNYLILKIDPVEVSSTISYLGELVDQLAPGYPFEYIFFEETFVKLYKSEYQMNTLIRLFALLAIFISSLGILGLSSYSVLRRTKEIGVRKVNGATSRDILKFLILENIRYVIISIVIAVPAGWILMTYWLMDYAFRIKISWWTLALAALIPIAISLCTIIIQILKKATESPVKSLRYE